MEVKVYHTLPKEAEEIRTKVFVEEQGFAEEFDETDQEAAHLVAFEHTVPIATCRFFRDRDQGRYVVGRLAVAKEYRGKNIGAAMLRAAEKEVQDLGGETVYLHAQCRASGFYGKQGYQETGAVELDQGCPHIWMYKRVDGV